MNNTGNILLIDDYYFSNHQSSSGIKIFEYLDNKWLQIYNDSINKYSININNFIEYNNYSDLSGDGKHFVVSNENSIRILFYEKKYGN